MKLFLIFEVSSILHFDKDLKVCQYFEINHSTENHNREIIERKLFDFEEVLFRIDHSIRWSKKETEVFCTENEFHMDYTFQSGLNFVIRFRAISTRFHSNAILICSRFCSRFIFDKSFPVVTINSECFAMNSMGFITV